jgi:hypothetical protein
MFLTKSCLNKIDSGRPVIPVYWTLWQKILQVERCDYYRGDVKFIIDRSNFGFKHIFLDILSQFSRSKSRD